MYERIVEKLNDKNIAILGFGKEGKSTYKFIRKYMGNIPITIIDKNNIEIDDSNVTLVCGDNYLDNLDDYDLIIKSPGISLKDIDQTNIKDKITSQLELLLEVNHKNIIGVTGTKGKSTTSSLIYEVLKASGKDVYLLGNIGVPVLDEIENYKEDTLLVVEMSSHQLEYIHVSPHIAIILNLFQDHLDHSGTLEHYHQNKMNIMRYQDEDDYGIYSLDNDYLRELINKTPLKSKLYSVRFDDLDMGDNTTRIKGKDVYIDNELVYSDGERKLVGDHNLKNMMFVLTVCKLLDIDYDVAKEAMSNFEGLKYRMEYIGRSHDILFYNDTIATIPEATISAVKALEKVDTLIFGGLDRKIDYSEFINFLARSDVNNLICMPTTGTIIGNILEDITDKNVIYADTLEEAYSSAVEVTEKDKICLLSPAAASYEYFKNFEEKGKAFEEIVKNDLVTSKRL